MVQAVRLLALVCVCVCVCVWGGGGGKRFEARQTLTISTNVFHVFISPSTQMSG